MSSASVGCAGAKQVGNAASIWGGVHPWSSYDRAGRLARRYVSSGTQALCLSGKETCLGDMQSLARAVARRSTPRRQVDDSDFELSGSTGQTRLHGLSRAIQSSMSRLWSGHTYRLSSMLAKLHVDQ